MRSMTRSSPRCFFTAIAATQVAAAAISLYPFGNQQQQQTFNCYYATQSRYKSRLVSFQNTSRPRSFSSTRCRSSCTEGTCEQTQNERKMTKDALSIVTAAIAAVNPSKAVESHLSVSVSTLRLLDRSTEKTSTYNMENYDRIYIAAFGKAAASMALATARIISSFLVDNTNNLSINKKMSGKVITKDDHASQEDIKELEKLNIYLHFASHPVPDERSIQHSRELITDLQSFDEKTLVINCISGGGSALFCTPMAPLNLSDISTFNQCLLASGMPIHEMNVLRKKVEVGKGGGLVEIAHPATCITMVLSDVIGDPLDLIASGPSVRDTSTYEEARALVEKYHLGKDGKYELPNKVLELLEVNKNYLDDEVSKPEVDDIFEKSTTVLVGNNGLAVSSAAQYAKQLGYNPVVLGTTIEGEALHIANMYVSMAQEIQLQRTNPSLSKFPIVPLPAALISGGETTVTLSNNHGKGGRNQEIGLAAGLKMRSSKLRDIVIASVGTDGTDGPTDAAGAIVDGGTIDRLERGNNGSYSGEKALRNHDAYNFFKSPSMDESLVYTGATGTNVADVCVILIQ